MTANRNGARGTTDPATILIPALILNLCAAQAVATDLPLVFVYAE